mgnify:CR=1 FL=1
MQQSCPGEHTAWGSTRQQQRGQSWLCMCLYVCMGHLGAQLRAHHHQHTRAWRRCCLSESVVDTAVSPNRHLTIVRYPALWSDMIDPCARLALCKFQFDPTEPAGSMFKASAHSRPLRASGPASQGPCVVARKRAVPRVSLLDAIVKPITTSGQVRGSMRATTRCGGVPRAQHAPCAHRACVWQRCTALKLEPLGRWHTWV